MRLVSTMEAPAHARASSAAEQPQPQSGVSQLDDCLMFDFSVVLMIAPRSKRWFSDNRQVVR